MSTIAPLTDQEEPEGLRLLSFDGGDLRAVSQLIFLEEIMRRVQWDRKSPTPILPCDYFHMMAGVGTGGIIVLLLTVLRMGVEEAIQEFIEIWTLVFADASLDRMERSSKLEGVIKDLLRRRGLKENQRLCSDEWQDASCKAFVCAVPETELSICEKFRSYNSRESSTNPTVVEAIRASCAAPALFTTVSIESVGSQVAYVTGAYNFNNPARETIKEAGEYFQRSRLVGCVLSLGCGQRETSGLTQSMGCTVVMSLAEDIASDCDLVERELSGRIGQSNVYYRLSVDRNLASNVDSLLHPIGNITALTKTFLEHPTTAEKVNRCAEAAMYLGRVTLTDICGFVEPRATAVYGLPPLSAFFVERPDLIQKMARCLFRGGPLTQRRMVLSGLGGIGKTQITISFLLQFLPRFRHVLFIDGSSEQSIEAGLITKVKSLGTTYSRSSAREALDVLSNPDYEITRNWAIIYDNVDDPDINIGRYFPSCAFGTIFITTRNPNVGILAPKAHLKLDVMSGEEAAEVLLRSAIDSSREPTDSEREEAHEIAKELGYLPVALVQAGYFIRVHNCMPKYRERLRKRRPDILGRPSKYQLDAHDGLYAALNLTWPYLTSGAQHFMSILGFVNYTGFPIFLLYRAAARKFCFEPFQLMDRSTSFQETIQLLCNTFLPQDDCDEQDVDDLVSELEQYSLVTSMITFNVTTLRLHPLVHSWAYDRLSEQERDIYKAAAVRLLVCGTGSDDKDIYEFIHPHLSAVSSQLNDLHSNDQAGLAMVLAHQGDRSTATQLWEGIRRTVLVAHGRNHPNSCCAALQLANFYWHYNNPEQWTTAAILENEAVEIYKRMLGAEHPDTLRAVVQQACRETKTYSPKDLEENHSRVLCYPISMEVAEKALRDALKAWERQPGDNWEVILQTKEKLASIYFHTLDNQEAISLCMEVVQARMERNGADDYATLKAMERLSLEYHFGPSDSSDSDESRTPGLETITNIWISIVNARIRRRGIKHPDTLDAMANLAGFCRFQENYGTSVYLWKRIATLRQAEQGDHEDTVSAMTHVATIYERCQDYTESAGQWEKITSWKTRVLGPHHDDTIHAMQRLAKIYKMAKKHTKESVQWEKIVLVLKEAKGPGHEHTLGAMAALAGSYQSAELYTESEEQWKEIVRVIKEEHGGHYESTLESMRQLASMYQRAGKYAEAEKELRNLIRSTRETCGPIHESTLEAMKLIVDMYERAEWHTEAILQLKEIVQVTREARGFYHKDTLDAMQRLAKIYDHAELYSEEAVQWKEIINETRKAHGPCHPDTEKAICQLMELYESCENYQDVLAVLAVLIDVVEQIAEGRNFGIPVDIIRDYLERLHSHIAELKPGSSED